MMNLNDLMNKTLEFNVKRENGASELVSFTYAHSKITISPIRCYPQDVLETDIVKERNKDYCIFHALYLPEVPSIGDTINYAGKVWKFASLKGDSNTAPYDVIMERKSHIFNGNTRR